ncbi:hypothetical protein KAF25_000162 [Fusarium avenaceum]|uniref:Complex 1 LYR protein domain-containing protein n=1 Tax=Fusarium avenaceum TaxID=40199 RepID=A0A9P7H043_9HYPO|nr:hypothetical protein KAF25_000162 [Fusarium avenaceum]
MIRQPFIAARSSRHRVAVLALYRALLRTGSNVPLPKDLHPDGKRHPIAKLLKKRFAKNAPLTSLRLIYDSMAAGYKFLALLTKGQHETSPEHSEILRHIKKRNETADLSRAKSPSFKRPPRSKQRHNPPLLTNVSAPDEPSRYEPTVRPLPKSAFAGERKVPVPGHTAELLSFLRMKKPEPRVFSRALGRKTKIYRRDMIARMEAETEGMSLGQAEDRWDTLMENLLKAEGVTDRVSNDGILASYRFSAALSKAWWGRTLDKHTQDWTARGEAISKLVEQERVLAKQEREAGAEPTDPEVAKKTLDAILTEYRQKQVEQEQTKKADGAMEFRDPFMAPGWLAEVQKLEQDYLSKSARKDDRRDGRQDNRRDDRQNGRQDVRRDGRSTTRDIGEAQKPLPARKGPEDKAKIIW